MHKYWRWGWLGLLLWVLAMLLCIAGDGIVWCWMLNYKLDWIPALQNRPAIFNTEPQLLALLHLFSVLCACLGFLLPAPRPHQRLWLNYCFVLTLLMPAVGVLLAALALVFGRSPPEPVYEDVFAAAQSQPHSRLHPVFSVLDSLVGGAAGMQRPEAMDMLRLQWLDIEPFRDILAGKDTLRKRNTLRKLAMQPSAGNIDLLRSCLADDNPEIRFTASSCLGQIEKSYAEVLAELRDKLDRHPNDEVASLHLARHYMAMASLGLGTKETQDFYRHQALQLIAVLPHDQPEVVRLHVAALGEMRRYHELLAMLGPYADEELDEESMGWKSLALLQRKEYAKLKLALEAARPQAGKESQLREAISFWNEVPGRDGAQV